MELVARQVFLRHCWDVSELVFNQGRSRPVDNFLLRALIFSLLFHATLGGGFELGKRCGWWKKDLMPAWMTRATQAILELKKPEPPPVARTPQEPPMLFVEVDPQVSTPDAPEKAKFYSSKNSKAANKDRDDLATVPDIEGKQTKVPKTEDVPRARPVPLQPSQPKPEPEPAPESKPQEPPKTQGAPPVGDLAYAKPATQPDAKTGEQPAAPPVHKPPRTLAEAQMLQEMAGAKMKQEGGVKRRLSLDSLDARATPFGEYDRELIEAIQNRWYDLLESKNFSRDRTGSVTLDFVLNYDGRVSDMRVVENNVDEMLCYVCQRAVLDPAPFAAWPPDMRRIMNGDRREVRFTFYYE